MKVKEDGIWDVSSGDWERGDWTIGDGEAGEEDRWIAKSGSDAKDDALSNSDTKDILSSLWASFTISI